jgi:hypothetical protein
MLVSVCISTALKEGENTLQIEVQIPGTTVWLAIAIAKKKNYLHGLSF